MIMYCLTEGDELLIVKLCCGTTIRLVLRFFVYIGYYKRGMGGASQCQWLGEG